MTANTKILTRLLAVVFTMGALAWAAVPFYSWFCKVTGYGGTTNVAVSAPDTVLDEVVRVRFDANVDSDLGWTFRPMQKDMTLRLGESGMAFYEAVNNTNEAITGTASYNVAPDLAGYYFNKIECFCFTEQTLQPGERVEMPVNFFVDPDILKDSDASWIRDITLSYTFHLTDKPQPKQASLDAEPARTVN
ncbi:cytochrome c oxidase assembly protein [Paracoccus aminophilus]|uniref:Cytochrome c oxidase assembly protein CtaG n=1 Tax=Paracoccus aminophilus JCM 7686 TaxID=1367847 RepID=S5YS22_PARAH|nr:cytochrome c oxidase assembly protein [Paracoccus aminophilus]AGT08026.1 cytochrome c oxidase subunit XI assembly protein [Paracoccus aminophilus JCM 7686]